jgi:Demethylmenaquinone methyltransferase
VKTRYTSAELTTPHIMDVQDSFGFVEGVSLISSEFRDSLVLGPATTVWAQAGENKALWAAAENPAPGTVLVVAGASAMTSAMMGENLYAALVAAGYTAVVVDGPIRDSPEIVRGPIPVACRGIDPRRPRKAAPFLRDVPVAVGNTPVLPGDWIAIDVEGVVRVPAADIDRVLDAALAAAAEEAADRAAAIKAQK